MDVLLESALRMRLCSFLHMFGLLRLLMLCVSPRRQPNSQSLLCDCLMKVHQFSSSAMIDSHTTAEYWKNRTRERLGIRMPQTYVVHLGNSKELMEVAEDNVARRVLREHVRESLGVRNEDLVFAIINSMHFPLIRCFVGSGAPCCSHE
ncbi:uncharacterized protein LOC143883817 isoform X2 [Tasmannia lanceolata]|uniref:uncharacterized protein LOC143883817 isoform X2 n=1 Tax=Tasmannia lanceolata TaxID=3420 RepID=UPI0040639A2D